MFDLVVVGHITIDWIERRGLKPKFTPGGSAVYASLAAKAMGAKVSVVSKVGADFPDEFVVWLSRSGVDLTGVKRVEAPTTRFVLRYRDDERTLQLKRLCDSILPEDAPTNLRTKAIHLGSVAGEIPIETVRRLASLVDVVSLDLQGFVRAFNSEGLVSERRRLDVGVLGCVDIVKASEEELQAAMNIHDTWKAMEATAQLAPNIVIVTKGVKGAAMLLDKNRYEVPACEPRLIVDPTGAGDAFIGAFMAEYVYGRDPLWCAAVGSSASSFVVEGLGPSYLGSRNEILQRANVAFRGIRKL